MKIESESKSTMYLILYIYHVSSSVYTYVVCNKIYLIIRFIPESTASNVYFE